MGISKKLLRKLEKRMKIVVVVVACLILMTSCTKQNQTAKEKNGCSSKEGIVQTNKNALPRIKGLTDEQLYVALKEIVGSSDSWQMTYFSNLKKDMEWEKVKAIYPDLVCDADKSHDYPKVQIKNNLLIDKVKFTFKKGKLSSATLLFKRQIDRASFKRLSLSVLEEKWGALDVKKRDDDCFVIINSRYNKVLRNYMVDHWEISNDITE